MVTMMNSIPILLAALLITSSKAFQGLPKILVPEQGQDKSIVPRISCGVSKNTFQDGDRIVGGRNALYGEFPWQVSLQIRFLFFKPQHLCGAAILNRRWIITAAHCVEGRHNYDLEVVVGKYKINENEIYATHYEVEEIRAHKNFSRETFRNDIALLKLKKPIFFVKSKGYVNGICLPGRNQTPTGFATATGWGSTTEGGNMSNILQAVKLPIVPHDLCKDIFGGDLISPDMLCAGEPDGGIDTCQGDSGGPLVQKDARGKNTLVGIVSWGVGCARPGLPGIYSSVSYFMDWIIANMK